MEQVVLKCLKLYCAARPGAENKGSVLNVMVPRHAFFWQFVFSRSEKKTKARKWKGYTAMNMCFQPTLPSLPWTSIQPCPPPAPPTWPPTVPGSRCRSSCPASGCRSGRRTGSRWHRRRTWSGTWWAVARTPCRCGAPSPCCSCSHGCSHRRWDAAATGRSGHVSTVESRRIRCNNAAGECTCFVVTENALGDNLKAQFNMGEVDPELYKWIVYRTDIGIWEQLSLFRHTSHSRTSRAGIEGIEHTLQTLYFFVELYSKSLVQSEKLQNGTDPADTHKQFT